MAYNDNLFSPATAVEHRPTPQPSGERKVGRGKEVTLSDGRSPLDRIWVRSSAGGFGAHPLLWIGLAVGVYYLWKHR